MKSKAATVVDNFILGGAVWLLAAIIARYYVAETLYVLIAASVAAMGAVLLCRILGKRSGEGKADSFLASKLSAYFLYKDYGFTLDYFLDALKQKYPSAAKKKFFIKINSTIVVPALGESLTLKNAVYFYAEALKEKAKTLVILAPSLDKNAAQIKQRLNDLRLEIFLEDKTYRLLKSLNKLPPKDKEVKRTIKLKCFACNALNPSRFKKYLFASFVLILGAYFSFFSLYFIVAAAVSIALAVLSKLNLAARLGENRQ